ncbi:hypothetical protein [Microbacterium sp. gxy059]|uniref:hypothetical protein n=1 Tax=Microbacterium sp. gxy059 TaxID=2957199 RepID=UPI003D9565E7
MASSAARPRRPLARLGARLVGTQGLVLPWVVAALLGIAVLVAAPHLDFWSANAAAAGICLVVVFMTQLSLGRVDGFLLRTSTASLGCVLILGILSAVGLLLQGVAIGMAQFSVL